MCRNAILTRISFFFVFLLQHFDLVDFLNIETFKQVDLIHLADFLLTESNFFDVWSCL